ncbi:hypothetical protein BJF78_21255 [Pseudonocardia sp. CNS-139]|nr:hypothetical protein BJF78_21255 [Pseudonocardia sp. CNS-139]
MIGQPAGRPPRRVTDVVEDVVAWVLTGAVLMVVAAAVLAGTTVHAQAAEQAREESAGRTAVRGVLLEDVPATSLDDGYQPPVDAGVRWTGPDGASRTGVVEVSGPAPAGSAATVWLDASGAVVDPPRTAFEAVAAGILAGLCVLGAGAGVLAAVWMLAREAVGRANARRWTREWAQVEPRWSGR